MPPELASSTPTLGAGTVAEAPCRLGRDTPRLNAGSNVGIDGRRSTPSSLACGAEFVSTYIGTACTPPPMATGRTIETIARPGCLPVMAICASVCPAGIVTALGDKEAIPGAL